jgi:GNAT superfamily N-acetyltransferase
MGEAPAGRAGSSEREMSESTPELEVRNPGEADEGQLLELLLRAFERWPQFEIPVSAIEHLRWKLRSDPAAVRHSWVGAIDGRIVVMLLRILRRVRVRGRDYLARDGVDAAVDPDYQAQGLYSAMLEQCKKRPQYREVDFGMSFSSNARLQRRDQRKGSRPLGNPVQVLHKPCRARAIAARRRAKYGSRLPAPLAVLRIKLATAIHRLGHRPYWRPVRLAWSISTLERFDERIDGFFDEAARPFDFLVVKSRDYLNWRYCEPAGGRFTVRVAEQERRLLGYLVLKLSEGNAYIADLMALPDRLDVVRSLIEDALRLSREARAELVSCWVVARHPYSPILRRYGFVDSRMDPRFVRKPVEEDSTLLDFLDDATTRIHLVHGDSDWI